MSDALLAPLPVERRWPLLAAMARAVDQPAREAAALSRRPVGWTAAPALVGLALLSASTLVASSLLPSPRGLRLDALRAAVEAVLVLLPAALVVVASARVLVSPRAFLGATAIGLLSAGIAAASLLPLVAWTAVCAHGALPALASPALVLPAVGVAAVAAVQLRAVQSLDPSTKGRLVARVLALGVLLAFAVRVAPPVLAAGGQP